MTPRTTLRSRRLGWLAWSLVLLSPLAAEDSSPVAPIIDESTPITRPPSRLRVDPFYEQHIDVGGVPILGSARVSKAGMREAARLVARMVEHRPEILKPLRKADVRIVVMHPNEMTTDLPEQRHMEPKEFWDLRARGLGGRVTSCGEENLLNLPGDRYPTENILIHEFAHSMHGFGMRGLDKSFDKRLKAAYKDAMKKGLWKDTYAATNAGEYWAEGVQSWFETNRENDALHNHVDTRDELKSYDPALAALVVEVYGDRPWKYRRYDERTSGAPRRFRFLRFYADREDGTAGSFRFVRCIDMDSDGDLDVVAGGAGALWVYLTGGRVAEWKRVGPVDTSGTVDSGSVALFDVERDGDVDIVTQRSNGRIGWWANPGLDRVDCPWRFRTLARDEPGLFSLTLADVDADGREDEIVAAFRVREGDTDRVRLSAFSVPEDPLNVRRLWPRHDLDSRLTAAEAGGADSLEAADVDGDGRDDIVLGRGWYRNPPNRPGDWSWSPIAEEPLIAGFQIRDFDSDGDLDVVFARDARSAGLVWYEQLGGQQPSQWRRRVIDETVDASAGFEIVDVENDGRPDVVLSEVLQEAPLRPMHHVRLLWNRGSPGAPRWEPHDISGPSLPCRLPLAVDLDGDRRLDLIGVDEKTGTLSVYQDGSPFTRP